MKAKAAGAARQTAPHRDHQRKLTRRHRRSRKKTEHPAMTTAMINVTRTTTLVQARSSQSKVRDAHSSDPQIDGSKPHGDELGFTCAVDSMISSSGPTIRKHARVSSSFLRSLSAITPLPPLPHLFCSGNQGTDIK